MSTSEAKSFADYHNLAFVETSAKWGHNVEKAFTVITQQIYDKIQSGEYKLEDGWDGIKKGYMGVSQGPSSAGFSGRPQFTTSRVNLAEGEPANRLCC